MSERKTVGFPDEFEACYKYTAYSLKPSFKVLTITPEGELFQIELAHMGEKVKDVTISPISGAKIKMYLETPGSPFWFKADDNTWYIEDWRN
jgi:hypothetical protein